MTRLCLLPSEENFTIHLLGFTSISNITLWADFVMGQLIYVQSGFGCLALFILSNPVFSVSLL